MKEASLKWRIAWKSGGIHDRRQFWSGVDSVKCQSPKLDPKEPENYSPMLAHWFRKGWVFNLASLGKEPVCVFALFVEQPASVPVLMPSVQEEFPGKQRLDPVNKKPR